ncbi:hypothetical protein BDW22DRAFT_1354640 [Trametopsis cervina]|nr:hypothetical protein BDW22DRAFT_1354640 [Trametopsis cervina]
MAPANISRQEREQHKNQDGNNSELQRSTSHHGFDHSPSAPRAMPPVKRAGRTDVSVPGPPPPYIPTIPLHASIIPFDSKAAPSSAPTSTLVPGIITPIAGDPSALSTPSPHGINVGLLVGTVLAGVVAVFLLAGLARYVVHRKARKIRNEHPRFSMWLPKVKDGEHAEEKAKGSVKGYAETEFGQFVYISNSDGDMDVYRWQNKGDDDDRSERVRSTRDSLHPQDLPPTLLRSHSSPEVLRDAKAAMPVDTRGFPASISAPASPDLSSPIDRDTSMWIQRQKAFELAQIVRMRIVQEAMPVHKATSCPDLSMVDKRASRISNNSNGLGAVQEEHGQEEDISSTALSALERYSIVVDPMTPTIPLTSLFHIDKGGKVVRLPSPPTSPTAEKTDTSLVSPSTSGGSSFTEGDNDEIEKAVIVRMAQARSMEIKRGMLVSMDFRNMLPPSRSAPMLLDAQHRTNAPQSGFSSPPPSLSPIVPSPTSLSADIEQTLEESVFAYRPSGEWSKENYKLTTPGQVRALAESLALSRPVSVQHQPERGWPWPAQRTSIPTQ